MAFQTTGSASSNLQAPPKANSVSNAIADFDPCLDRAANYAERLQVLCDRLNGPRPTEVGKPQSPDHPSALLNSIHDRRSRLVMILDDMERSLQTLDSAI